MPNLTEAAKEARIKAYGKGLKEKLAHRIIDTGKPAFDDLYADGIPTKKMTSLNGAIILERDLYPDGRLRGVVSVDINDLASMLSDLKVDATDKSGWKKHLDKFKAEGKDILAGVADPIASEYEVAT